MRSGYTASLAPSPAFGRRLRTLAYGEGADRCQQVGVVADGGVWIWQEVGKYFASKRQILDFYHVTEHLWTLAQARFGGRNDAAHHWVSEQKGRLLSDRAGEVMAAVQTWRPRKAASQKIRRNLLAYLQTHRHRMAYQTFRAEGWHIGSGVIEAGCKCVVKARMGGAGMRWSRAGAEAMLQLCAAWRSSDPIDFRKYAY